MTSSDDEDMFFIEQLQIEPKSLPDQETFKKINPLNEQALEKEKIYIADSTLPEIENTILDTVFNKQNNILLSGSGGCGKSYFIVNKIKKIADENNIQIFLTSTTGVSAISINGTTIHRWSGIKLGKESVYAIINKMKRECKERWLTCKILVIDEISMLGKKTFELIDRVGREVRECDKPFGGIQVIFSGDFLQLKPVNDEFVFKSPLWKELNIINLKLTVPKRYNDLEYFNLLQRVRIGKPLPDDINKLKSRVHAYIEYIGNGMERKSEIKPTRIYSLKKDVEKYNLEELSKLPGEERIYEANDKFTILVSKKVKKMMHKKLTEKINPEMEEKSDEEKKENINKAEIEERTEFLNTTIPKKLQFRVGAQVMLTYNLDLDIGLVNGSRGVIKSLHDKYVNVLFKNGINTNIGYNEYEFTDSSIKMVRNQIPLILAWAISVHKSQGSTLDCAIIDLGPTVFDAGMSYVELSRIRNLDGVLISSFIQNKIYADKDALEFEKSFNNGSSNMETFEKESC